MEHKLEWDTIMKDISRLVEKLGYINTSLPGTQSKKTYDIGEKLGYNNTSLHGAPSKN